MSRLAFLHPALLGMGLHVAAARAGRAIRGHKRYPGSAADILRAGLEDCWSGTYLTASPGHYRQLWTRDLGFAAPSLVRLGGPWPGRVLASLEWAIDVWRSRRSHVTTTINPLLRWPADIFDYGVDSLPLLLASLQAVVDGPDAGVAARATELAHRHRAWFRTEVAHFVERVVDPATGLVRTDRAFSAHRDTFRNGSTAYANTMVAVLARVVTETGWGATLPWPDPAGALVYPDSRPEPPTRSAMPIAAIRSDGRPDRTQPGADREPPVGLRMPTKGITAEDVHPAAHIGHTSDGEVGLAGAVALDAVANGDAIANGAVDLGAVDLGAVARDAGAGDRGALLRRHFWLGDRFRDRLGTDETSGEANVAPFFFGVVEDPAMLTAALGTLRREGFTMPYPLRFEASHRADGLLLAYRLWSPDYQTTTSWTSLGAMYLALLRRVDPEAAAVQRDRMRDLIERDGTFWEVLDGRGRPWRSKSRLSISDQSMLWGAILLEELERP